MNIAVYFPSNNIEHQAVLDAFAIGVRNTGDNVLPFLLEQFDGRTPGDIAVVFGVGKAAVYYSRLREAVRCGYHKDGKRCVVLEKGYVQRDEYYAAGWDGLNGRADFMNADAPPDRWDALGCDLSDFQAPSDGYVLLAGQVPWDASVERLNHVLWLQRTAEALRKHTNRLIVYRPHPLSADSVPEVPGTATNGGTLEDAIDGAYAVVTQSSNVGVDAMIVGRSVFAADCGSMVYGIANHDLSQIEQNHFPERHPWANELAYAQWTKEEMAAGHAWQHLRDGASLPVCRGRSAAGAPCVESPVGSAPNNEVLH